MSFAFKKEFWKEYPVEGLTQFPEVPMLIKLLFLLLFNHETLVLSLFL